MVDLETLSSSFKFLSSGINEGNYLTPIVAWTILGVILLTLRYSITGNSSQEKKWISLDLISKTIYGAIVGLLIFIYALEICWLFLLLRQIITDSTGDLIGDMIALAFIGIIFFITMTRKQKNMNFKPALKLFFIRAMESILVFPILVIILLATLSVIFNPDIWSLLVTPIVIIVFIGIYSWMKLEFYEDKNKILKTNKLPLIIRFEKLLLSKIRPS